MKYALLALLASLMLGLTSCNRGPQNSDVNGTTPASQVDLTKIQDFGVEAIKRYEKRMELTPKQKSSIMDISKELNFAGANASELQMLVNKLRERINAEVLTTEQRKMMG